MIFLLVVSFGKMIFLLVSFGEVIFFLLVSFGVVNYFHVSSPVEVAALPNRAYFGRAATTHVCYELTA